MKQIYCHAKAMLIAVFFLFSLSFVQAQNPTTVAPGTQCSVIQDFNQSSGGFHSPSLYTESDYTEFRWSQAAGHMIETSGLANRSASLISGVYLNTQLSGGIDLGFSYQVCQNAEYRIRVIKIDCICVGGDNIVATTANGPEWTRFPSTSGQLCLRLNDADLIQGQQLRFEISIRNNSKCDFVIDDFALGQIAAAPLPVTFLGVIAKKEDQRVNISWDVAEEINVSNYQVERSTNGISFTAIGSVRAQEKPAYSFTDQQPLEGVTYYRIRNLDMDGKSKTSNVVKVVSRKTSSSLKVSPLPARNAATLQHAKLNGESIITLSSIDGRIIKRIIPQPGSMQTPLDLTDINPGIYLIRISDGTGNTESIKLIRQ